MRSLFHLILIWSMGHYSLLYADRGVDKVGKDKDAMRKSEADPVHEIEEEWGVFLGKYMDPKTGRVDYQNIDITLLKQHLSRYAKLDPAKWSDSRKKAAYINFYNAGMIYNLLRFAQAQKISVSSKEFLQLEINDIDVPGGNIWNGDYTLTLNGRELTLDNIEHDLIRGKATSSPLREWRVTKLDPRIHAAVNCAAASCPRIREQAYTASNLDRMLDDNVREWLANPNQFKKLDDGKLRANSILYWYYEDFDEVGKQKMKGAGDYLATFIDPKVNDGAWMAKHFATYFNDRSKFALKLGSSFEFFYDWQINDQRNFR